MKMKTAMKKLFSLLLVAVLVVGMLPFQASADAGTVNVTIQITGVDSISVPSHVCSSADGVLPEALLNKYLGADWESKYNLGVIQYLTADAGTGTPNTGAIGSRIPVGSTIMIFLGVKAEDPCAGGHAYADATCTAPKTCSRCGATDGAELGHAMDNGVCSRCGYTEPVVRQDITWEIKHVEGGSVVDSGSFTPKGETAAPKDILYYHVFNKSNAWQDQYTVDKVWSNKQGADVGYDGAIPEGDTVTFVLTPIEPDEPAKNLYKVTFNVNKDGNNSTFSRTYEEGTVLTLNAALVNEVKFGSATVEWIVNGIHETNGGTVTVDGPMTVSCSITNKETEKVTIGLDTEGGRLPSYVSDEYTVVIGQPYGNLPTPTREGYTFAYWYYEDDDDNEVRVYNTTIVKDDEDLHAKWIANGITVTFQRYDMLEGWVNVEKHTVPVNSVLTVEDGTFPSDSRIDLVYDIPDFEIVGWEIGDTDKKFEEDDTEVTSNITIRPRYRGKVRLVALEPVSNASWKSFYETLEIGEVIGDLENPGSRSTFAFAGWVASNGTDMICDEYCDSKLEYYPHLYGTTFYSVWAGGTTVRLHIHTNGNTSSASKIVPYYVAPATGKFDLNAIDMYSIYGSYYKYDDDCDDIYGWYDAEEWKNYCANRAAHPATSYMDIVKNNRFDFHIMLINNGEDSSSSSSAADSSNPKTGDMIMTPVIVLCASVGALATLFYLNKKRSI